MRTATRTAAHRGHAAPANPSPALRNVPHDRDAHIDDHAAPGCRHGCGDAGEVGGARGDCDGRLPVVDRRRQCRLGPLAAAGLRCAGDAGGHAVRRGVPDYPRPAPRHPRSRRRARGHPGWGHVVCSGRLSEDRDSQRRGVHGLRTPRRPRLRATAPPHQAGRCRGVERGRPGRRQRAVRPTGLRQLAAVPGQVVGKTVGTILTLAALHMSGVTRRAVRP